MEFIPIDPVLVLQRLLETYSSDLLARELGVTRQAIWQWENRKRAISPANQLKIWKWLQAARRRNRSLSSWLVTQQQGKRTLKLTKLEE